jgi:hypothetical protein
MISPMEGTNSDNIPVHFDDPVTEFIKGRDEINICISAGAYTATLYVIIIG